MVPCIAQCSLLPLSDTCSLGCMGAFKVSVCDNISYKYGNQVACLSADSELRMNYRVILQREFFFKICFVPKL